MLKLMAGVFAIFASLTMTPSWGHETTKKAYDWVDHSVVSYEQLQKTQHCYAWVPLSEEKQQKLKQDKK